jgi:hypothetical protein
MITIIHQGYVVGWGSLALINTGLAQLQGRNGLLWFFISLVTGPFATLWLVCTYQK